MKPEVSAFLQGKQFVNTKDNQQALAKWLADRSLPRNPENLAEALVELSKAGVPVLEWNPTERARQKAQADFEYADRVKNDPILKAKRVAAEQGTRERAEKEFWRERSKPLPGENSLQTLQRVSWEREEDARKNQPKAPRAPWVLSPLGQMAQRERDQILARRQANYRKP